MNNHSLWTVVGNSQVFRGRGFKVVFNEHTKVGLEDHGPETIIVREHPKHELHCFVGDLRKEVETAVKHNIKSFTRMFKKHLPKKLP
jgi:hypothetical protein